MNIIRWIFFLPIALATGFLAKLAWDVFNKLFPRCEPNSIGQWLIWGTGEVLGILVVFYIAITIVPNRKRIIAYVLCSLGIVIGLLTIGYLVYLLLISGINSEDSSYRQDIIQGLIREIIETSTIIMFLVYIIKGKIEYWFKMPINE